MGTSLFRIAREYKRTIFLRDVQARLMEPDRIIPGGFIYMSDILYDWHVMTRLGEIIMTRFVDREPDYILTVETKGIPLAVMVARASINHLLLLDVIVR